MNKQGTKTRTTKQSTKTRAQKSVKAVQPAIVAPTHIVVGHDLAFIGLGLIFALLLSVLIGLGVLAGSINAMFAAIVMLFIFIALYASYQLS